MGMVTVDEGQGKAIPGSTGLWVGLLVGHFAWTAQLLLSYFVVSLACLPDAARFQILGVEGYQFLLGALTAGPAAVALAATILGVQAWRGIVDDRRSDAPDVAGWQGFLAQMGAALNGLFLATILLTGLSLRYLAPCAYG
jgi:hypothetical protein